ncbi:MAG: glycoside hydrolase family 32 protein [Acidimicrobiales bacterium]
MSPIDPFPHLHTRPSHGWVNDPNGIGRWEGRWHVMYQWNPNAPDHGDIHWGHMSSTDLLSWRDEGVALRPRPGTIDAAGVWSGVAVPEGGGAALVYTAVSADASTARVAVARQESDGDWVQPERTATDHPDHGRWFDVRDPFVVLVGGRRLGIMGAGQFDITNGHHGSAETRERTRTGAVLVYDADDLDDWRLLGTLLTAAELPAHMVGSGTFGNARSSSPSANGGYSWCHGTNRFPPTSGVVSRRRNVATVSRPTSAISTCRVRFLDSFRLRRHRSTTDPTSMRPSWSSMTGASWRGDGRGRDVVLARTIDRPPTSPRRVGRAR